MNKIPVGSLLLLRCLSSSIKMSDAKFKPVTHVIFDMDGLLIDTELLYQKVFNDILRPYGKEFTWDNKADTMGFHTSQLVRYMIDTFQLPLQLDELTEMLQAEYRKIFPTTNLLPDSERIYKKIYGTICGKYGYTYGGDLAFQVLGRPERIGAELIVNHFKLPLSVPEFQDIYHQLQRELFVDVKMMPGAERLLNHLKKNNIPFALATSSSKESFELKTKHLMPIFDLFHHRVIGGSDPEVKHGKPSPDIFLVAAKRFENPPEPDKCLVFEDAPNGVQAGINAGMQTVMVPDSNLPKQFTEKATLVLNSLEEFKPELFGLPKFD